jgi:lysophospholipase L1-like esterase
VQIDADDIILFTGDSITDGGRRRETPGEKDWGWGYVRMIATQLQAQLASPKLKIYNRGQSGNRIYDLEARLQEDLLDLRPTVLSILIGINDTWRRYDSKVPSPLDDFRDSYRRILTKARAELDLEIILLEPFLLPVPDDRKAWREDLDPRIGVVRELAVEFGTELLPLDGLFAAASTRAPASFWLPDGVHPSDAGYGLIAQAWLEQADI